MFLYNLTIHVEWQIHDAFLQWLENELLPDLLQRPYFHSYKLMELLGTDEQEGKTYSLQLYVESMAMFNRFSEIYSNAFFKKFTNKWGQQCYLFPSLLRELQRSRSDRPENGGEW